MAVTAYTGTPVLERYTIDPLTGCWNWAGSVFASGYGRFCDTLDGARRTIRAHRHFFEAHHGKIPEHMYVCHRCDNRLCVNPAHLFLGTHQDNMRDMSRKGRRLGSFTGLVGQKMSHTKLKDAEVLAILKDSRPHATVAADYGVSMTTVAKIRRGESWKWIPSSARRESIYKDCRNRKRKRVL